MEARFDPNDSGKAAEMLQQMLAGGLICLKFDIPTMRALMAKAHKLSSSAIEAWTISAYISVTSLRGAV
jgi:hypothetical protein